MRNYLMERGRKNAACGVLKPLYGLSTACKGWYRAVSNFLAQECGGKVASLGKSVSSWAPGGTFVRIQKETPAPEQSQSRQNEFKVNGNFLNETKGTSMGLIAIHVYGLLISGPVTFLKYISFKMKENLKRAPLRGTNRLTSGRNWEKRLIHLILRGPP